MGGSILLSAGTLRLAEDFVEVRALGPATATGERFNQVMALVVLGRIAAESKPADANASSSSYVRGIALAEELGVRPFVALCHLGLGRLHRQTGEEAKAQEHLVAAATMFREMDMPYYLKQAES